jgi:hypothetical protein
MSPAERLCAEMTRELCDRQRLAGACRSGAGGGQVRQTAHARVADLLARHPLYPEIDLA